MALAIQIFSWALWFPLQILGMSALLRVGVRRYPLIFVYMVATFLLATVQAPMSFAFHRGSREVGDWYQKVNSVGNAGTYLMILAIVVSFVHRSTAKSPTRRLVRTAVSGGAVLLVLISFLVQYSPDALLGVWMSYWSRDVHFGAAILDLAVWGMLVASRERDPRLLLLTGGMGIMFAGEAVGAAVRSLAIPYKSYTILYTGHILRVLANAAFQYIWWQTFRSEAKARKR
jgi:hypothetical protein